MIEFLIILGWVLVFYLVVTLSLLASFFIPSFFVKSGDPSGGLLTAFISMTVLLFCVAWPITIPLLIYQHFTKNE